MFRRWRQENYFKYMDAEFALDALVEYGVDDVPSEATRPNPERKKLAKERKEANAEVTRLHAELGMEANTNEERRRPTMRGFKVAQADLRARLQQAESTERGLAEQLAQLPKRVPAKGLKTQIGRASRRELFRSVASNWPKPICVLVSNRPNPRSGVWRSNWRNCPSACRPRD